MALVDLDHRRGGLDVLLGVEERPGARWADLAEVRGTVDPGALDGLLPRWSGVDVLSAGTAAHDPCDGAVDAVMAALVAGHDTVVVDLPARCVPRAGPDELSASRGVPEVLRSRTDLVLVVGQDVLGVAGALSVRTSLDGPSQLVLRSRRRARVGPLEVARVLDLPILGTLPTDRAVGEAVDRGLGPLTSRWSRLARAVNHIGRGCGRA